MIKIEETDVYGWQTAIRGMRNPKNSWDKSDSRYAGSDYCGIGEHDLKLMETLAAAGTDHGKYLRMIIVTADITAPLYWWKEYDTYKVGTVANSCSTMHKIHARNLTLEDFSVEHLTPVNCIVLESLIRSLNEARERFAEGHDKKDWWQIIQLLPSSYNQKRTVQLNYAVLKNMYHSRQNHKLDEWREFCKWVETLPYNQLITK